MGLTDWLRRLFGGKAKLPDEIPEIVGYITDENGERKPLYRGFIQHESLSSDLLQRIGRLRDVLIEPYPMTLDGWVDGFLRDRNPESEVAIIEACAVVYQQLTAQVALGPEEKKRLYAVLCALSAGGGDAKLAAAVPDGLPDLETIAGMYQEARESGSRP